MHTQYSINVVASKQQPSPSSSFMLQEGSCPRPLLFCLSVCDLLLVFLGFTSMPASLSGLVCCPCSLTSCCWPFLFLFCEHWPSKPQSNLTCSASELCFWILAAPPRAITLYKQTLNCCCFGWWRQGAEALTTDCSFFEQIFPDLYL